MFIFCTFYSTIFKEWTNAHSGFSLQGSLRAIKSEWMETIFLTDIQISLFKHKFWVSSTLVVYFLISVRQKRQCSQVAPAIVMVVKDWIWMSWPGMELEKMLASLNPTYNSDCPNMWYFQQSHSTVSFCWCLLNYHHTYPDQGFCDFHHSLWENCRILSQMSPSSHPFQFTI